MAKSKQPKQMPTTERLPQVARAVTALAEVAPNAMAHITWTDKPEQAIDLFRTACQAHLQTGVDLGFYALQLKELVGHGQFTDIINEMGLSLRSVQMYIKVAKMVMVLALSKSDHVVTFESLKDGKNEHVFVFDPTVKQLLAQDNRKQVPLATLSPEQLRTLSANDWERIEQGTVKETEQFVRAYKRSAQVHAKNKALEQQLQDMRAECARLANPDKQPPDEAHKYYNARCALVEQDARRNVHQWMHMYFELRTQQRLGSEVDLKHTNMMRCLVTALGTSLSHYVQLYNRVTEELAEQGIDPADMYLAPATIDEETAAQYLQAYNQWINDSVIGQVARKMSGINHYPRKDSAVVDIYRTKQQRGQE